MSYPPPPQIEYFTADEVAECLSYRKHLTEEQDKALYIKLWNFVDQAVSPTPVGGDGTNGTVETPEERLSPSNTDKVPHWWSKLEPHEQEAIIKATEEEFE